MDVGCLEVVVNRKSGTLMRVLFILAVFLTVCFVLLFFLTFNLLLLIPAAGFGVGAYFAKLYSVVDYEYAYVERELRIARIYSKQKRKEVGTYDLGKMQILAPIGSHELDRFQNREEKVLDFSSGDPGDAKDRFVMIMEDNTRLILDLAGETGQQIIKQIAAYYPRKVFKN